MKVFKFGGASVKSADAVRNIVDILRKFEHTKIIIVVSAMGKMTNLLEKAVEAHRNGSPYDSVVAEFRHYHSEIIHELGGLSQDVQSRIDGFMEELDQLLSLPVASDYGMDYDRIVSIGELVSTSIIEGFLKSSGFRSEWLDVRNVIVTDQKHQNADVNWTRSSANADIMHHHLNEGDTDMLVTQGFIGRSALGNTTTLGREGSDFSAAILAYLCDAEDVTIWKDVPGMLNADPKWFNNTIKLEEVSYRETIELSYYGASVIHPKTIKPLQNKNIPLYVKSFLHPEDPGTSIRDGATCVPEVPSYIFKADQVLISISPKDFSFIVEQSLSEIFQAISDCGMKINLMQNSALSFSIVVDNQPARRQQLMELLSGSFSVRYNEGLKLLTIRHYDKKIADSLTQGNEILVEQRSRHTWRIAMRELSKSE
ncbi:MAG: aspartate kinase [Flavobacteriales bacterium]|nr:aspartate kinase [Flavobacteriales bacterium]